MTTTLLLRCAGPMQSWGTRSRFSYRDTEAEPSKSGVIGLVAAALGRERTADLADLSALRMAVRIDRAGHVETDYQTALGVAKADGSGHQDVLSWRSYLADASFLVALEGDRALLERIDAALASPRWPLCLGRKSFVPGEPVRVPEGLLHGLDALEALRAHAWPTQRRGEPLAELAVLVECIPGEEGDARLDVPLSFALGARRFGERRVRRIHLPRPEATR